MNHPLLDVRGWHKMKKAWYYLSDESKFRLKLGPGFNVIFERQPEPRWVYKLSWFSSLFDSERRKIYSADILLDPDGKMWEVIFDAGRFDVVGLKHKGRRALYQARPGKNGWRVVGDIYANPGLCSKLKT